MLPVGLLLALLLLQAPQQGRPRTGVFAPGTRVLIRFAETVTGGRDREGEVVGAQVMEPLEAGGCILVPAFTPILGTVVASQPGHLFGGRGYLQLRFDSVLAAAGTWVPLTAVLDSLEWERRGPWSPQGGFEHRRRSIRGVVGTAGVAGLAGAATGVGLIPVLAVTGFDLALRGPRAQILAGQHGMLRLTSPLVVRMPDRCESATPQADHRPPPQVPPLPPRAMDKHGTAGADPINLIVRGSRTEVDSAMSRAGWLPAKRSTFGALAKEAEAILFSSRDSAAPMSHEYYLGRVEDLRFERSSPSARKRHHVRFWQADSTGTLWAAAATEDVGMYFSARAHTVTHRVAPDIDRERDLLVGELLAGGCALLEGYVALPGATLTGKGVAGQPFVTDGRAAVMKVVRCPRYTLPL